MPGQTVSIAVTGATGLVGSTLTTALFADSHRVVRVMRAKDKLGADDAHWDPEAGEIDSAKLKGIDAAVNLAGENLAAGRWSEAKKASIRDSRVKGTELLARTLAGLEPKPKVLVSASAVGFYGDSFDAVDERSPAGAGFLADVCGSWEEACMPASKAGIRVVNLRIGVVLSPDGGALGRMLPPFRMGVGGPVGGGRQWMSWISIADLVAAIRFALFDGGLSGPVNATAPNPVRNGEFAKTLGRVLRRPAVTPLPAFAVRMMFGEMGEALLLGGQKVAPARLEKAGFRFRHPELEPALRHLLGR
ncbi:MAG: TIGR01777 family oxidoreductase [Elusimicrobiota bacterium]